MLDVLSKRRMGKLSADVYYRFTTPTFIFTWRAPSAMHKRGKNNFNFLTMAGPLDNDGNHRLLYAKAKASVSIALLKKVWSSRNGGRD